MKNPFPNLKQTRCPGALWLAAMLAGAAVNLQAAASYSDTILSQGPIGYWRFNDGVTVPVVDEAANLGTLGAKATGTYNGALHPVTGALAKGTDTAASMVGGTHVAVSRVEELNGSSAFTVETWLKPAVAFTDGTLTCAISSGDFVAPRAGWLIYQSSAGFNLRLYNQNGTSFSANISSAITVVPGSWYHVAAVYDGSDAILYLNGEEVARATGVPYVAGIAGPLTVGMRADNSFGWNGSADEVAYYGVALSDAQILKHYQTGTSAAPAEDYNQVVLADAPLGYWRLNEAAFVAPVAANSGSLAAAAKGAYRGGATNTTEAPLAPAFLGFEAGNTALGLDGVNDYVSTLSGMLNGRPSFTVSGWIRRGGDQPARTGLWGQNDLFEFGYIGNDTIQAYTDGGLDLTPNPIPNEEWAHLAVVVNGGAVTIYTNGVAAIFRTGSLPGDNAFGFNIGGGGVFDGGGNFFNGQIDEVALFDKPLSAAAVCNQYAAAVPKAPEYVGLPISPDPVYAGATVTVFTEFCGSPDLKYQWYRAGGAIVEGATGANLVIASAKVSDSGDYFVRVTNDYGTADSETFNVTVLDASAPIVDVAPLDLTRYAGGKAVLSVGVSGTPPFTYQWQRNEANIPGATSASLTLDPLASAQAGSYRVLVKNVVGEVTSLAAVLTVIVPTPGSYEAAVVATKPDAYWRLGEKDGTTAFDYAGGFDGTYNNVTQGADGAVAGDTNPGAEFTGGDSAVTTPASLNGLTAFTLTGWIRRSGVQANRTGLFGQNDVIEFGFIDDQTLESYFASGDSIDVTSPIADQTWAFVALRGDSQKAILMVDGSPIGRIDGTFGAYGNSTFKFNIGGGGIFDGTGNGFVGRIDEVTFHARTLTDEELCGLYLAGTGAPFDVTISSTGGFIADVRPGSPKREGLLLGASLALDNAARKGVLSFNEAEGDQVIIPADPAFNSSSGTISFWVNTAGVSGGGNEGAILFDRRTSSGDVIVQKDDGTLFVQATTGGVVNSFSSTASIADGAWHHVAYVYNQAATGSTTLYIDGVQSGSKTPSAAWIWPATQQIELGRSHDGYWKKFNGLMDDFRIYSTVLSEGEIGAIAGGETAGLVQPSALQVRYDFDGPALGYTITWTCGVLQSTTAFNADGTATWTDVVGAGSPYSVRAASGQQFYRVRR